MHWLDFLALGAADANRSEGIVLQWLRREGFATLAMLGTALTVMGQLATLIPMAPPLAGLLQLWQDASRWFWHLPFDLIGAHLHRDLVAALTVAVFMAAIGIGARISGRLSGAPLPPLVRTRFLDGMTWPSLLVFAALCIVFLFGHGASHADPLVVWGSRQTVKFAFAVTVTAGYAAGDYFGHGEFHSRLLRLAVLVPLLVAANAAVLHMTGGS